jgi:tRNA U34 5-methylaminomethyl-2-thiouridine-forming methyltransferase MnmC
MKKDAKQYIQLQKTRDGSFTLLNTELGETYHSRHGAFSECKYVYIEKGLNSNTGFDEQKVLEVGFGTGLNAWLSSIWAVENACQIEYCALEPLPLSQDLCLCPMEDIEAVRAFQLLHGCPWEAPYQCNPYFTITKNEQTIDSFLKSPSFQPNLVFYDAFAPGYQPEMWHPDIFKRLFEIMIPNGILVTYCAKGDVRRALKQAGFKLERLKGPPGKREMVRARKMLSS